MWAGAEAVVYSAEFEPPEQLIRPFTTLARPCRKDWLFVRKEALVSWQPARRVRVTQPAPSALTDPGLVLVRPD
jgi:hypothetical protein